MLLFGIVVHLWFSKESASAPNRFLIFEIDMCYEFCVVGKNRTLTIGYTMPYSNCKRLEWIAQSDIIIYIIPFCNRQDVTTAFIESGVKNANT